MKMKRCDHNDNQDLLTGYEDGSFALWDLRQNKMVDKLKVHPDALMCMDFSNVLNKGYSGSVDEDLHSWTITDGKINASLSVKTTNPGFNDALVRKDGKLVVFAGWDGNIRIFGAKKLKPLAVLNYHKESVHCLAFSEDNILACGSKDELITLWDIYR
jgi:WD40 repeat protein